MRLLIATLSVLILAGCSTAPPPAEKVERHFAAAAREAGAVPAPPSAPDLGAPGTPLPLDRVLAVARATHPGLQAARAKWIAATQRPAQERSPDDPMFSYEAATIPNGTVDIGRSGERHYILSQPLRWWGKLELRGTRAEQEAAIVSRETAEMELEVLQDVARVYDEAAYAAASLERAKENLVALSSLEKVTEVQYKAGRVPQKDVLQAQVEVAKFSNEILMLEQLRASSLAEMNRLLGRAPDAPIGDPFLSEVPEGASTVEPLYDAAKKDRPAIAGANLAIQKAKTSLSIAEKDYYPDFTVEGGYKDNSSESADGWVAGVSFNVPLWFGRRRAAEHEAAAEVRQAEHEAADTAARVMFEVKDAWIRLETARKLAKTYDTSVVPQAEQSLKALEEAYRTGRIGFLDVIDGRRTLYDVSIARLRARTDFAQAQARLDRAVGRVAGAGR